VSHDVSPGLTWRPTSFLALRGGVSISSNHDQSQWIGDDEGHYVFGRLDQHTVSLTARVNYTVTPTLSIQVYAQPFVSAGDYSNFKELVDGRAPSYADRYRPYDYASTPDFNYRSFRTTNVLRWEYRPGSAFYAVWSQGRTAAVPFWEPSFASNWDALWGLPADDVFLVKLSYWFSP
jgi:hypothetical protein